jgi:hypothetical protein
MTDKIVAGFLLLFVVAAIAIGSLVTYSMFGTAQQTSDTFGNQFGNRTNQTRSVESSIAPVSITIEGYMALMAVVFIVVGAVLLIPKAIGMGGSGRGRR